MSLETEVEDIVEKKFKSLFPEFFSQAISRLILANVETSKVLPKPVVKSRRLTTEQKEKMKKMRADGVAIKSIAEALQVKYHTVCNVIYNKSQSAGDRRPTRITKEQKEKIKKLYRDGMTVAAIMDAMQIKQKHTVYNSLREERRNAPRQKSLIFSIEQK